MNDVVTGVVPCVKATPPGFPKSGGVFISETLCEKDGRGDCITRPEEIPMNCSDTKLRERFGDKPVVAEDLNHWIRRWRPETVDGELCTGPTAYYTTNNPLPSHGFYCETDDLADQERQAREDERRGKWEAL